MIENISVVIITKNASETIKVTLDSLTGFKEVVVFDNGSTDNTIDIVQSYENVSFFQGEFIGFGPTKNIASNLARNDWIFSIDSDESISNKLYLHLSEIDLESKLIGEIRRDNYFMGKEIKVASWGRDKLIRLFNRTEFRFSNLQVHEKVEVDSSARKIELRGSIKHNSINNLSQTLEKANFYSELYAKQSNTYYPLWIILFKSLYAFIRIYFLQRGFLAGWRGLVLAYSNSVGVFYKYIKVYARQKQRSKE